jgi:hypothetical protein
MSAFRSVHFYRQYLCNPNEIGSESKKLIALAAFLSLFCFGSAYFFLGTGWSDDLTDVKTYYSEGPTEKRVLLVVKNKKPPLL